MVGAEILEAKPGLPSPNQDDSLPKRPFLDYLNSFILRLRVHIGLGMPDVCGFYVTMRAKLGFPGAKCVRRASP